MELKEFIKQTLIDITAGIDEANKVTNRFQLTSHRHQGTGESGQRVEFDVTVVVNDSTGTDVNGGIKVAFLNMGGTSTETESNQHTQKIKFEVFIAEKVNE